jgi:Ala-tRNA(Pro) deacylase
LPSLIRQIIVSISTHARVGPATSVTPGPRRVDIVNNSLTQSAKSIVVRITITKKKGQYLLAVIPGDKHVDLVRLSQLTGGMKAALAARDVAERLTTSVSGSIAPFSFNRQLRLIVDQGLLVHEEIFFNAARLDRSVALHMEDYLSLTCPWVENIATEVADGWKRGAIGLSTIRKICVQ